MKSAKQQLKTKNARPVRTRSVSSGVLTFLLLLFALSFALYAPAVFAQGLVPCGGPGQPDCTTCHLIELANNVVRFGFNFLILPLAALGILAGGLVLLTAGGSETQLKKGKSMLTAIIIGFFIAAAAWIIINTVLGTLVQEGKFFNPLTETFPACKDLGSSTSSQFEFDEGPLELRGEPSSQFEFDEGPLELRGEPSSQFEFDEGPLELRGEPSDGETAEQARAIIELPEYPPDLPPPLIELNSEIKKVYKIDSKDSVPDTLIKECARSGPEYYSTRVNAPGYIYLLCAGPK